MIGWPREQQQQGPEEPEAQEGLEEPEVPPQSKWLSKLLAQLVTSPGGVLMCGPSDWTETCPLVPPVLLPKGCGPPGSGSFYWVPPAQLPAWHRRLSVPHPSDHAHPGHGFQCPWWTFSCIRIPEKGHRYKRVLVRWIRAQCAHRLSYVPMSLHQSAGQIRRGHFSAGFSTSGISS